MNNLYTNKKQGLGMMECKVLLYIMLIYLTLVRIFVDYG